MKVALIFLISTFALTSCGVKKTAAPELGDLSYSAYSSCYGGANQRNSPPRSGVVDSGYFGKLVDRSDLNQLLVCNIPETAQHAANEHLTLYVVNQNNNSCNTFSFLKVPSSHVYSYWKDATGASGANSLLGLYKEDCGDSCQPDTVINPLVLLNACTDRWTMVHEMTHHNFNVQRKRFRPLDSDEIVIANLLNELNVMQQIVGEYNNSPSEYGGMQLVHALDRVRDLLVRFTYQTAFEEVSIESMLMREYAYGNLQNVPSSALRNSISYIRFSTAAGVDRLAPIKSAAEDLGQSARANGWSRVARNAAVLKAKLETFEDDASCYEGEATAVYQQARVAGVFPGDIEWDLARNSQSQVDIASHVDSHSDPKFKTVESKLRQVLTTISLRVRAQ